MGGVISVLRIFSKRLSRGIEADTYLKASFIKRGSS